MNLAVILIVACIIGVAVSALLQLAITSEMEMRLGDPPNLTFFRLWLRQRSSAIESEFAQRYPGDRLIFRLRIVRITFVASAVGAFIVLFGILPRYAPPSR